MTQILGAVTYYHTFHVSDRLLTQSVAGGVTPFDHRSNKAVVFRARDAHVVLGYSGRAYLDSLPTDTFIAQSVLGVPLHPGVAIQSVGLPRAWTDIGRAFERLRVNIDAAFVRLPSKEQQASNLAVLLVGWRRRKSPSRVAPVVWKIVRPRGVNATTRIERTKPHWNWQRGYTIDSVPDVPETILEALRADLRQNGGASAAAFEAGLIRGMNACSEASPQVIGNDILSIVLYPSTPIRAEISYLESPAPDPGQKVHSPWIIAPPTVWSPAILADGGGWASSSYEWKMRRLNPPSSPSQGTFAAQPRPKDPQL